MCENLRSENLVAGFRGSGLCPLDRTQVPKKIPGTNRDPGVPETNVVLNESVMQILRTHCGIGVELTRRKSSKRGKKVVPGKPVTLAALASAVPVITLSQPLMLTTSTSAMSTSDVENSQPCSSSSNQPLQCPESSTKTAAASYEQWICSECNEPWEEGDDRWIVCGNCAKQYHLQCSGIQYAKIEYYSLNIEEMNFFWLFPNICLLILPRNCFVLFLHFFISDYLLFMFSNKTFITF